MTKCEGFRLADKGKLIKWNTASWNVNEHLNQWCGHSHTYICVSGPSFAGCYTHQPWRSVADGLPANIVSEHVISLTARLMGPTWGPSGAGRTQVGPMLVPWTLLSGIQSTKPPVQKRSNIRLCWNPTWQRYVMEVSTDFWTHKNTNTSGVSI